MEINTLVTKENMAALAAIVAKIEPFDIKIALPGANGKGREHEYYVRSVPGEP